MHLFRWYAVNLFAPITYTVFGKKSQQYSTHIFYQILADFRNSFIVTMSRKFAIKHILPHIKRISTLTCEMLVSEKLVMDKFI